MNKYRSHNCTALGENDIGKSVTIVAGFIVKEIMEIFIFRFKRSLRYYSMCNRK